MVRLINEFEINEIEFPTAMNLTCSDSSGYCDSERWWTFGEKDYGYSGEIYMAATPKEAIRLFIEGEGLSND